MTIMRARFSEDDAYLYHARAAAICCTPLPMPELDELDGLIASATFHFELDWLIARRAELLAGRADALPCRVRHTEPIRRPARRPARHTKEARS